MKTCSVISSSNSGLNCDSLWALNESTYIGRGGPRCRSISQVPSKLLFKLETQALS